MKGKHMIFKYSNNIRVFVNNNLVNLLCLFYLQIILY